MTKQDTCMHRDNLEVKIRPSKAFNLKINGRG